MKALANKDKQTEKGKARKEKKRKEEIKKKNYYIRFGAFVLLYVLVLVNIFTRYDAETERNTVELKGTISNVVYDTNQGQAWLNFDLQNHQFCYVLQADLRDIRPVKEHKAFFQQLEENQTPVTIRYTEEREWVNFFHHIGRDYVVQIENSQTGEVYYPMSYRNSREHFLALVYFIEATIGAIVIGFILFTDTFLHIIEIFYRKLAFKKNGIQTVNSKKRS